MQSFRARNRTRALCITSVAIVLLAAISACGSSSDTTRPAGSIAGSYVATAFSVTPSGQPAIDVLTAGGSLHITVAADSSTTGTLDVPASVTGSTDFVGDMTGSASVATSTVQFQQTADTFVRDLTWTRNGTSLTVVNQTAGSAAFTITLTRQ
jgi:hypothetical protein